MSKTETIKERAIWVYLPSMEQKQRWQNAADQSGASLSRASNIMLSYQIAMHALKKRLKAELRAV